MSLRVKTHRRVKRENGPGPSGEFWERKNGASTLHRDDVLLLVLKDFQWSAARLGGALPIREAHGGAAQGPAEVVPVELAPNRRVRLANSPRLGEDLFFCVFLFSACSVLSPRSLMSRFSLRSLFSLFSLSPRAQTCARLLAFLVYQKPNFNSLK